MKLHNRLRRFGSLTLAILMLLSALAACTPAGAPDGTEDTTVDPDWSNKIAGTSTNEASGTCFIEGMDHTFNVFTEEDLHSLYTAIDATGEFFAATLK